MKVEFTKAKDGTATFTVDNVFFHSTYSPAKEAERFVQGSSFPITPKLIFFIEPGFSYCVPFFKKQFQDCKLVCIRLFERSVHFDDESNWDKVFYFNETQNFGQTLINTFTEDLLLASAALVWKPAENFFKQQIHSFFEQYKQALLDCKTILVTRQFFEKKWLVNSCNFVLNAVRIIDSKTIRTELPVVVCASGPSLEPCIPVIKKFRKSIFIICLSSATSVLINNEIIPDIVLSTDGGYWAGEHLKALKAHKNICVAASPESFVPKTVLQSNPVLALKYNDTSSFISSSIIDNAKIKCFETVRNPTVSGTALFFANSITTNNVYFCGLDMAGQKGFQHTQPNELEKNNALTETRLKTKNTRLTASRFNSDSLKIYEQWFKSLDKNTTQKTLRVIDQEFKQNSLGNIADLDTKAFEQKLGLGKPGTAMSFSFDKRVIEKSTLTDVRDFIYNSLKQEKWQKQLFPADFISQNKSHLDEKLEKLQDKIRKLFDE